MAGFPIAVVLAICCAGLLMIGSTPRIERGDLVQWELDGRLMFPVPMRIDTIKDYDGRPFALGPWSPTGIPLDQLILIEKRA